MSKFKVGQTIMAKSLMPGLEKATITKIDSQNYYCKIMCGVAIIPISTVEKNYELYQDKKRSK